MASAAFSGNSSHTMDAKGRVTIPAAYRAALGEDFTVGMNNELSAIALYPKSRWESIEEDLNRIPPTDIKGMRYVRLINGNSFPDTQLDAQGRVLLPQALRNKAGLVKNVRFVGVGQSIEIWDESRYVRENESAELACGDLLSYVNELYYKPRN
ncbi:MAG: division/cell wall cluster transcriptional repressor MraZ [Clostridia bacterium]|nr:division/cell wall cluster transcriptional repressor MraZ [Clostridia bacterium]